MRGEATMRSGEATLTDVVPPGIITEMEAGKEVSSDLVKSCFLFNALAECLILSFLYRLIPHLVATILI